ncbi:MAG: extracellular solute-binding protein [Eubacterium ventriosum]
MVLRNWTVNGNFAEYLGTEQEDGTINRKFVANGTGGVIFKNSEKKEASWEFLKWWTSKDVQTEYIHITFNIW